MHTMQPKGSWEKYALKLTQLQGMGFQDLSRAVKPSQLPEFAFRGSAGL